MTSLNANSVKRTLHEIATQANNLGMGLQNVAPPEVKTGGSVQYLKEIAIILNAACNKIDEFISNNPR
jgi:hypothetical protein